jgi:hypothetical protein
VTKCKQQGLSSQESFHGTGFVESGRSAPSAGLSHRERLDHPVRAVRGHAPEGLIASAGLTADSITRLARPRGDDNTTAAS